MNDDDLEARFDALRTDDAARAPSFASVTRAREPRRTAWVLVPVSVLALAALASIVLYEPPQAVPHVGLSDPEPLAFLLAPVVLPEELP